MSSTTTEQAPAEISAADARPFSVESFAPNPEDDAPKGITLPRSREAYEAEGDLFDHEELLEFVKPALEGVFLTSTRYGTLLSLLDSWYAEDRLGDHALRVRYELERRRERVEKRARENMEGMAAAPPVLSMTAWKGTTRR